jgi:hypothetical protein
MPAEVLKNLGKFPPQGFPKKDWREGQENISRDKLCQKLEFEASTEKIPGTCEGKGKEKGIVKDAWKTCPDVRKGLLLNLGRRNKPKTSRQMCRVSLLLRMNLSTLSPNALPMIRTQSNL